MKDFFKEIKAGLGLLKKHLKLIIQFQIIYNSLMLGIIYLLTKLVYSFSLKLVNLEYLSNVTFFTWLKSPFTIITLIIVLLIWVFSAILELSGIIRILELKNDKKISCWLIFYYGIKDAERLIKNNSWRLFGYLVVILPSLGSVLAFSMIKNLYLPDYFIKFIINRSWLLVITIFILFYLYVMATKWLFTIYYFVIKKENFKAAFKDCQKKMKPSLYHALIGRTILWLVVLLLSVALTYIIILLIIFFCKIFLNNVNGYKITLQFCYWVPIIIYFVYQILIVPTILSYMTIIFKNNNKLMLPRIYLLPKIKVNHAFKYLGNITLIIAIIVSVSITFNDGYDNYKIMRVAGNIPKITAHRGASMTRLENTMSAFEQAIIDGSDYIELDVHETKDGVIVVNHDANLKRLTGHNVYIYNLNYSDLIKYPLKDQNNLNYGDINIVKLADVLEEVKGRVKINIELKPTGHELGMAQKVIALVNQYDMKDSVVIASMNEKIIKEVDKIDSSFYTVYNMAIAEGDITKLDFADAYSVEVSYINQNMVNAVHNAGKEIYVWTVNSPDTMRKVADLGVDNIITDNPAYARDVLLNDRLESKYDFLKNIFNINAIDNE
jgi:glycerophosphoryl diester phosphodiesterase